MMELQGRSVYKEICIGRISYYRRKQSVIKRVHVSDILTEINRFQTAKQQAVAQLRALYDQVSEEVGEADASIFEIHQMMLEDLDYCDSIENIISVQQVNAEYAVGTTADNFAAMFEAMEDEYMKGRAADVRDVSERLIRILQTGGQSDAGVQDTQADGGYIIAADDLAPSETVQLDKEKVLGFILQQGSVNSHTAILARSMGIPAIIGLGAKLTEDCDGKMAVVDGYTGKVYLEPDAETMERMQREKAASDRRKELLQSLKGKENRTKDGRTIKIYANIGSPADVIKALENDAGGIGLFRSEFLYLENADFPSEEQQFLAYKQVAENMAGKKVVIRTMDIGADKQAAYFHLDPEENPALGYRAIRICLTQPDIFKTQLRALYRAALFGNISIMYPMITAVEEVRRIKAITAEVQAQLAAEGVPYKKAVETGIMIETPAAALISDELAKEVDFFSIGTNDLIQYTLAADRQNRKLEPFVNTHHRAVLKLIEMAAAHAHAAGIWIGICGELGADTSLTRTFLEMGIDELSVSPSMVLRVRDKIRRLDLSKEEEET